MAYHRNIALFATASLFALATPALAQNETPQTTSTDTISDGDIIVTAQRRDESLSKTPVSVAVISSDTLAKAQVVSEQDLRTATPGLSIRATTGSNQLNYSLRGQSQDAFSGTLPGVLPYINEVQIGGSGGSTAFYDLQSVQVLKGPQGTLFGRSATGGAVLFTTAKPTDTFGGYVSGLYGNYNAAKIEGALNVPLAGDKLMARVAGFYNSRDGFQKNLYDGGREGDVNRWGLRGSLSANLGSVKNDLVVDYFNSRGENTFGVISGLLPFTGTPGEPPYIPIQFLYAGTATPVASATGIGTLQAFTGAPAPAATAFYNAYFANPKHPANGVAGFLADQTARGPFLINSDAKNLYNADNVIVTNSTSIDVGSDAKIKNIVGYTHLKSVLALEADGTPYSISSQGPKDGPYNFRQLTKQFSDELQLSGKAFGGALNYVTGLYYSNQSTATLQQSAFFDLLFGGPPPTFNYYTIKNRTLAAYAQGTYQLNDSGLAFTGGLRYTSEKVSKIVVPGDTARVALGDPAPAGYSYDQSRTYNRLSWQIGIQDQVNPNLLLYAVSRRAYKSGGYNGAVAARVGSAENAGDSYRAERVTDVEVGAKYQGQVGTMPTRLAIALFNNWISDSQRTAYTLVNGGPASLTVNVPKGRTYGVELEGQIKPAKWLSLGGSFNYLNAKYTNGAIVANGSAQVFDLVPDTPEVSGTIFADVTVPVSAGISVLAHGDVYGQSKTYTTPRSANSFGTTIQGYALANFRLGLQAESGWSLTANLKNAFNRVYYVGGLPTGEIYQINTLVPGDPRTFTVEARFKF